MTGKNSPRVKHLLKLRYDQLKEAGICVTCGKFPATESAIRCTECLRKKKISDQRAKYRKILRKSQ